MKGLRIRILIFFLLLVTVFSVTLLAVDLQLEDGTPVLLALKKDLSSASAKLGTKVEFTVLSDITLKDFVVVKKGAAAWGIVKDPKEIKKQASTGGIGVSLENVEMANGAKAPIREDRSRMQEPGATSKVIGGVGSASKTIGKISTGGLLFKGKKDVTIPAGTQVRAVVKGIVLVDPADFTHTEQSPTAAPAAVTGTAPDAQARKLTNKDIVLLKAEGFSDDVLMAKIKASPASFNTDPNDLIELKKAGISDAVIRAMIEAQK